MNFLQEPIAMANRYKAGSRSQALNANILRDGVSITTVYLEYYTCLSSVSGREFSLVKTCPRSLWQVLCQPVATLLCSRLVLVLPQQQNMAIYVYIYVWFEKMFIDRLIFIRTLFSLKPFQKKFFIYPEWIEKYL